MTESIPATPEGVTIDRIVSPGPKDEREVADSVSTNPLRPMTFEDYPGQTFVKANLEVYVRAAQKREEPLDHVLLHGPPGLGKTTLALIIARECDAPIHLTSGPSIEKPGDLAGILAGLEKGAVFFIDEVHRLSTQVEEVLYSAMEDFAIDLIVGQGSAARSMRMPLAPFTLVGATTKLSSLSRPFLNRFGIQERLQYYDTDSLTQVVMRSAGIMGVTIDLAGAELLAARCRGTPRIANRMLRRIRDFAEVSGSDRVDAPLIEHVLERLGIDKHGLDPTDRQILKVVRDHYGGGPVGIEAIAVSLGEERATVEEVYEPFLVHHGFLCRGPRGRSITDKGLSIGSDDGDGQH